MDVADAGFGVENTTDSTDWTDYTDYTYFPEYRTQEIIMKIFTPCILLVGSFGNMATICVMCRIKDHSSSQHVILMTLAVSDFLFIQTGMMGEFLWNYFYIDWLIWHSLVCKLFYWLPHTTGMLSAWLVTCVTVQRTMSITWPHKMRVVCTLRRTWIVIASLVFTACIVHIHVLVGFEIISDECETQTDEYENFFDTWVWVDMLLSSLIPSLCQIVCDVILCMALFKAASMSVTVQATSDVNAEHDSKSRRKTASNITVLCLALSFTFLILTLPVCILIVWKRVVPINVTERLEDTIDLMHSVFFLLWHSNSAVNFFLYCVTGTRFRKEFLNWICCKSQRHSTVGDVSAGTVRGRNPNN